MPALVASEEQRRHRIHQLMYIPPIRDSDVLYEPSNGIQEQRLYLKTRCLFPRIDGKTNVPDPGNNHIGSVNLPLVVHRSRSISGIHITSPASSLSVSCNHQKQRGSKAVDLFLWPKASHFRYCVQRPEMHIFGNVVFLTSADGSLHVWPVMTPVFVHQKEPG